MMLFTNNAICALALPVAVGDLQIFIDPTKASLFPQPVRDDDFFLITLEADDFSRREIIKIVDRIGNQLIVDQRGFEGTTPQDWGIAHTYVDHRVTAYTLHSFMVHSHGQDIAIASTDTEFIDLVPILSGKSKSIKWQVVVNCPGLDKAQSFELHALVKNELSPVKWTKNAILGDKTNVDINIVIVASTVKLSFQNNESETLTVDFIRVTT